MNSRNDNDKRTSIRQHVNRQVEFFVDADIIQADSVDLSQSGIRMTTRSPINIAMRIYTDNNDFEEHNARLVWAKRNDDETMDYGFEFTTSL